MTDDNGMNCNCLYDYAIQDLAENLLQKSLDDLKFREFWFTLTEDEQEDFIYSWEDIIEAWLDEDATEIILSEDK